MSADKLSISLNSGLGAEVRRSARRGETSISAWLAEAAAAKLRLEALGAFLDDWEREHGPFTDEALRRARAELGLAEATPER